MEMLSCIHPAYLKEMQSASFGKDLLSGENATISPMIIEAAEQAKTEISTRKEIK